MDIQSDLDPPTCRLRISGEIDLATADTLRDVISMQLARGNTDVSLDLGGVSFMDSSGVHALAWALAHARQRGGRLTLGQVSRPVTRIITLVGASRLLDAGSGTK